MARAPLLEEIERAHALYPGPAWREGSIEESGKSNLVLLPGDPSPQAVFRMARTREVALKQSAKATLVDSVAAHVPWRMPESLSRVDEGGGVVQVFIPGTAHPLRTGDPHTLQATIEALLGVPRSAYENLVQGPWEAEPAWTPERQTAALEAVDPDFRQEAEVVFDAVASLDSHLGNGVMPGLVHGDLAGRNMHWRGAELVGVLDWDKASLWDPALNLAHLSLWHGQNVINSAAPCKAFALRAHVWNGSLALTRVADAAIRGGVKTWGRLLRKTQPRIRVAATAARQLGY